VNPEDIADMIKECLAHGFELSLIWCAVGVNVAVVVARYGSRCTRRVEKAWHCASLRAAAPWSRSHRRE
jgi:hypothetical protein